MNLYVDFKRHTSITISQYWHHLCVTDQRDNFSRSLYSWTSLGRSKNCPLLAISKNAGLSYFHCLMFQTVCHGYNKQTNRSTTFMTAALISSAVWYMLRGNSVLTRLEYWTRPTLVPWGDTSRESTTCRDPGEVMNIQHFIILTLFNSF